MGVYYKAACDELREKIDPGKINDLGVKAGAIAHPEHPFGSIVVFSMLGRWNGCTVRLANDSDDDEGYFDYQDVTKQVVEAYNEKYGTEYKTP